MLNPMMLNPMMMSMMGMGMNPMNLNQMSSLMHQQQMIIPPSHTTPIPTPPAPVPLMQQTNLPIQSQNTHNGSQAPMPLMATTIIPPLLVNNLNGEKKNSQNIHQLDSLDIQTSLISQRPSKIETPPIGTKIIHPDDDISLVIYVTLIIRSA